MISVIIPAFNEEDTLGACLDSLHLQSFMPDEIIVVDNNSTDGTAEIAARYENVKVIKEKNQGIMPAVYTGMNAARGDIIARCDADSVLPRDWIETIVKELAEYPSAAGITGPGKFYGTNSIFARAAQIWYMYSYFVLVGSALANWPLFGSNCAIRRSTWLKIQPQLHRERADIHDDMDMSIHISVTERIIFKPSLVVGISARSLRMSGMKHRYAAGFRTLTIHWPDQSPVKRWKTKLMHER